MAHTFDIRFARSAGIASFLEAPTNPFRWTGSGSLSIDTQGISVAARRGFLSLLGRNRPHQISRSELKEVFREGDSLRVDFATGGTARASLRFWARDRDTAARIVQLLPTTRTVELEENAESRSFRFNWRMIALLVLVVAAMTLGFIALPTQPGVVVEGQTPSMQLPAIAAPTMVQTEAPQTSSATPPNSTIAKPRTAYLPRALERPREIVIPIDSGEPTLDSSTADRNASETLSTSEPTVASQPAATSTDVAPEPIVFRVRVSPDGIVPIVPGMAAYEKARRQLDLFLAESESPIDADWWAISVRITNDPDFKDPALSPLRDMELAVSRAWRTNDEEFARLLLNRVRQYVD